MCRIAILHRKAFGTWLQFSAAHSVIVPQISVITVVVAIRYSEYSEAPGMAYVPNTTLVASRSAFDLRLDTDS